jgi:hypothetical protein
MRQAIGALVVVGALVAGACGDDDDAANDSSANESSVEDGSGGNGSPSGGSGDESTFCDELSTAIEALGADADTEVSEEQGLAAIDELTDLDPPAEIAEDYQTFVEFVEFMTSSGDDTAEPDQAVIDEWTAAADRLSTYAEDECGLAGDG